MTQVDVQSLYRLWNDGVPAKKICEALGVTRSTLDRLATRHALPKRPRHDPRHFVEDIPQDEIEARAAEVRAGWSDEEASRRAGRGCGPVVVSRYSFDGRVFSGLTH